ncbi:MAG: RidA family protein [Armatimonadota bacterium]|nr:RidA family protein [Armatimonadota bacterium]MDR7445224.1 RidA family protein [Armatimonadota bacterium]MDR7615515.1 RidA family protein [Armatimonadota bacterium]
MARRRVPANRPWEAVVGYSRAVRVGSLIEVSGTAPADERGNILGGEDYYAQTRAALEIIGQALRALGASLEHVVRTRIYLRDPSRWEEAGRAHGEVFGEIRPATTIVGASGFVDPRILVEIEATAVVEDP